MFFSTCAGMAAAAVLICASTTYCQVVEVSDFSSTGRSVHRSRITEFGGSLYFNVGIDDTLERELWRFDGTQTELVQGGFVGDTETSIDDFTVFQGNLFFSADDGQHGNELFRYDGNSVTLAADLQTGSSSSYPVGLFVHNDELFFSAKVGESFNSLWKYDGTEAIKIAEFANPRASFVTGASFQGDLYFGADDGEIGMELWKYDGSQVSKVADVNPGAADAYPRDFKVFEDKLYFKATTQDAGQELWEYDGTNAPKLMVDTNPGKKSSDPRGLIERDGSLYFSAVAYGNRNVYRHDGESTTRIADGGGPIEVNGELMMFRGNRSGGEEVQELYSLEDDVESGFYRSLVPSAGPFAELGTDLFFSCECDKRELYMAASAGDSNSDGDVTFSDFLTLSDNFGDEGGWHVGDFDMDGNVDFDDFLMQSDNFGLPKLKKNLVEHENLLVSIPEPSTTRLLLLGLLAMLSLRRQIRV